MRTAVSSKAAPGRPPAFSRDDILKCALKVLDRDGVEALTMRGLARELDTGLGTINHYFANLADLEDALAARLLAALPVLDAKKSAPIRDQLVELGLALIHLHSRHPHLRHITGSASADVGAQHLRQNWDALEGLGLPEEDAVLCMDIVFSLAYSHGTDLHRVQSGGERAVRLSEELWKKAGKTAPPAKLTVSAFTPEKLAPIHRALLERAIDTFLRGCRA